MLKAKLKMKYSEVDSKSVEDESLIPPWTCLTQRRAKCILKFLVKQTLMETVQ